MNKSQFDHGIRAAAAVLGVSEVLVIGSQAAHASVVGELPSMASRSMEVDIAVFGDFDGSKADLIDGSIGEASMFHSQFGYYAQGVSESTAVLPEGWQERLVRYETPATNGVAALCLELHDLWLAKAVAGREKDNEFCKTFIDSALVDPAILKQRLATMAALPTPVRERILLLVGDRPHS